MVDMICGARQSVRLEMYIYRDDSVGQWVRDALVEAARKGVKVRVLVDSVGSQALDDEFWDVLRKAGAEVRWFNPFRLDRFAIRNHRKLLLCDDKIAMIGGFNIAEEYEGDGITRGWCDLGAVVTGKVIDELMRSFDLLYQIAEFRHARFKQWRKSRVGIGPGPICGDVLLNLPGTGHSSLKLKLNEALAKARDVRIISAYFLPTWKIRRQLQRIARSGGRVQIILAGKSDVLLSQTASRSLYRTLLQAGVEIYEYEPQILHAKLYMMDDCIYAGSANLDKRSLSINYELLVRTSDPVAVQQGREIFADILGYSRRVTLSEWKKSRSLWTRLWEKVAYVFLVHLDPYVARQQLRMLR